MVKMATHLLDFRKKITSKMAQKNSAIQRKHTVHKVCEYMANSSKSPLQIVLHTIIITAIILLSSKFVLPLVADSQFGNATAALITLIIISPFLWALSLRRCRQRS
jgi:CPA2 family monovalent cation:H+ antiporter-2